MITIQDFAKVELKTGKVVEAEQHPNADKLIVMQVDMGDEKRQIVGGLRDWYAPEDLVGKEVVLVTNLEPATLRGVESNGMLLAAEGGGDVAVLKPDRPLPPGSKVK